MYELNKVQNGYNFWKKWLTDKVISLWEYENLPNSLPYREIEKRLISQGNAIIFDHPKYGIVTANGGGSGVSIYNHFTHYVYSQPILGSKRLEIGKDCQLLYCTYADIDGGSVVRTLINRYAQALADCESSTNILTVNSRSMSIFTTFDQKNRKEMEIYNKKLREGDFYAMVQDGNPLFGNITALQNYSQNTTLEQLISVRRDILSNFYEEIGIAHKRDKVAEMTALEVGADGQALSLSIDNMIDIRREYLEKVNDLFGLNIKIKYREDGQNADSGRILSGQQSFDQFTN